MNDQDDLAMNAYLELKQEVEKRGAISSDRVKTIVMGHLGLQRLRRQRIDPILHLGVKEGVWGWYARDKRNPFDLTKAGEKDEQAVTCSEELEEWEALLASNAHPNALDNWRRNHPVPEEEETKVRRRPRRSPIAAALTEAGILPEEEKEEEEEPTPTFLTDRKGILDYTLREVLDAILEHIRGK